MASSTVHDSDYRVEIGDLQVDLARAGRTIQDQRRALDLLSGHLSTLKQQYSTLQQHCSTLEQQYASAQQALQELKSMRSIRWLMKFRKH